MLQRRRSQGLLVPWLVVAALAGCSVDDRQVARDLAEVCAACRLSSAEVGEGDADTAYVAVTYRDGTGVLKTEEWQYFQLGTISRWALQRRDPLP